MGLIKKTKTANKILHEEGMEGIITILKRKLDTGFHPDESMMVFDLFKDETIKGVMLDIGAHHGSSLQPFAEAGWQVFAFEPDSENRVRLIENTRHLPNVKVDPRAISDKAQQGVPFFRSEESSGVSSLTAFLPTHANVGKVDVITLSDFFEEAELTGRELDFLKIDTEGYDLMVLKGLPWERVTPRMILCEFEDFKTLPLGYSFHIMAGFLVEKGYKLLVSEWQPIERYGELHHWKCFSRYPCKLEHARAWGNIFAVKEEDLYQRLMDKCGLVKKGS